MYVNFFYSGFMSHRVYSGWYVEVCTGRERVQKVDICQVWCSLMYHKSEP